MKHHEITAFAIRLLGIAMLVYLALTAIPVRYVPHPELFSGGDLFGRKPYALNACGQLLRPVPLVYPLSLVLLGLVLIFAAVPLSKLLWAGIADHHD